MEQYRCSWLVVVVLSLLVLATARPQDFDDDEDSSEHNNHSEKNAEDVSRVQIKVYRGATKDDGYAPWGYWVKQPSDD